MIVRDMMSLLRQKWQQMRYAWRQHKSECCKCSAAHAAAQKKDVFMLTHTTIAIGLVLYVLGMLAASLFWMRRVSSPADYLVGGRSFPYWILTGTTTAGCIGAGVMVGASGLAYSHGWAGAAYPIGLGLGTAVAGLLFAGMRRYKFMTLSEEIASYYDNNRIVVEFSNITLFLSQLGWLTVQIIGGAAVLGVVTSLPRGWCVLATTLVTAIIAIPGGLKSVVYTDFLQAIILLTGFTFLAHSALHHTDGLSGLMRTVPPSYNSFLGIASYGGWNIAGLIVTFVLAVVADPGRRLSMYGARTQRGARWSMVTAGLIVITFSSIVAIVGMYAYHLHPHMKNPDQSLLWLVMQVLPPWLAALVVVAVASGIISCANYNVIASGTFFVRHIYPLVTGRYPRRPLTAVRLALTGALLVAGLLAYHARTIVQFVIEFLPVTMSGLAIIILVGRFWRRGTWQGAVAALITTPIVSLALMWLPTSNPVWHNPIVPACAGALAHLAVSAFTPPSRHSFQDVANELARDRENIETSSADSTEPAISSC